MATLYHDPIAILQAAGCDKIREGKYEIWRSPISGRHFPVPRDVKSKHTASAALKQAGLPKKF